MPTKSFLIKLRKSCFRSIKFDIKFPSTSKDKQNKTEFGDFPPPTNPPPPHPQGVKIKWIKIVPQDKQT